MKRKFSKLLALLMCMAMFVSILPAAYAEETPAAVADTGGDEAGVQESPLETAPENGETAPATEDEVSPVEVEFICTPEELTLSVYAKEDEAHENLMEPREDGKYLLLPGLYTYTAVCEGYVTAEDVEFEVEADNKKIQQNIVNLLNILEITNASGSAQSSSMLYSTRAANVYTINNKSIRYTDVPWIGKGECWEYANRIYSNIWGVRFSSNFYDSDNVLQYLPSSERTLTVEHLKAYVGFAALGSTLRITGEANCSEDGDGTSPCHSVIIVAKSDTGFTTFESYDSGTFERTYTWQEFVNTELWDNQCTHIKYIKWPNAPKYNSKCTLTFDANGGTCATTSLEVQNGGTLSSLPTPTRAGYRFLGWFSGKALSSEFTTNSTISQNMTLYAHWARTQNPGIKISFNANGGILPEASLSRQVDGVNIARGEGYLCIYDFPDATIETNRWGSEVAVDKNGIPGAKRAWSREDSETLLTVPTMGFVLSGHEDDSSRGSRSFVEQIWDCAYIGFNYATMVVSAYDSLDAYLTENKYVETGYTYGDLPTPTRDGYSFDGWYTSAAGGSLVTCDTYVTVTSSQTLYAHWSGACEHTYDTEILSGSCSQIPGIQYTCAKCGDTYFEADSAELSDWSSTKPTGVNHAAIESRIEYRYQIKEATTGSSSTMTGWTLSGSEQVWGEYGAWSGWSTTAVTASDATQVETSPLYRYYYYLCAGCGDHNPLSSACGCGSKSNTWHVTWLPIAYKDSKSSVVSYATAKRQTTSLGDGQLWYFSSGNLNSSAIGTVDSDSSSVVISQGYRYRTRTQNTIYHFYRWSDWSEWSSTPAESTDSVNAETRTLYRYYLSADSQHEWNSGVVTKAATCETNGIKTYTCSVCGKTRTETIAATGHQWGPWVLTTSPTETSDGIETRTCQVSTCGKTETRSIAASFVTVTFNANGGTSSISSKQVLKGGTITALPSASRDGYNFEGWYTAASGGSRISLSTTFNSDTVVFAHWEKIAPTLSSIKVSALPAKAVYDLGEELDTTGLSIEVSYDDGTKEIIASGFDVSGFDSSTAGTKTVTVSYNGKSTTFTVTVKAAVSETDPQIIIESKKATAGESITVTISLKNNPGIASLKLKVAYDPSLTLTEVVYNTAFGGQFQQPQRLSNPVTLNWYNGAANSEGDWLYATLTFIVSDNADGGSTAIISATYNPDDVYDITETNIPFAVINGTITVIDYIPGDINGDGEVNNKDITRLFQYLSDWDVSVNERALDVNGDGDINNKDLTRLFQYLSDWDVEIY